MSHDLTTFTWITAPAAVGPGLKQYASNGPIFIYGTMQHGQVKFDLRTRAFTVCPDGLVPGMGACHW